MGPGMNAYNIPVIECTNGCLREGEDVAPDIEERRRLFVRRQKVVEIGLGIFLGGIQRTIVIRQTPIAWMSRNSKSRKLPYIIKLRPFFKTFTKKKKKN